MCVSNNTHAAHEEMPSMPLCTLSLPCSTPRTPQVGLVNGVLLRTEVDRVTGQLRCAVFTSTLLAAQAEGFSGSVSALSPLCACRFQPWQPCCSCPVAPAQPSPLALPALQ